MLCFNNGHFIDCELLNNTTIPNCSIVKDMNIIGLCMGLGGWMLVITISLTNWCRSIYEARRLRYVLPETRALNPNGHRINITNQ